MIEEQVLQEFFGVVNYSLIFGFIVGFVWWLFKRH